MADTGLTGKMWDWTVSRIESLPPIEPASLLAIVLAVLIIIPLWRAAVKNSQHETYVPDQPSRQPDPVAYSEAAPSMLQYMIGLDRDIAGLRRDQEEILKLLRAPDGGSYLYKINENLISLNRLLRSRSRPK